MSTKTILIGGAAILIIAGLAIGLTAAPKPTASSVKSPEPNTVVIASYKFNPNPIKIKQGTTVTWSNTDIARHNIVSDGGQAVGGPNGPLFGKGETYKFTFNTVGTFKYHCEPHPYMHGSVEVTQ